MNKRQLKEVSRTGRSVLKFHTLGAARAVTGSLYLFELFEREKTTRFLVDAGLTVENQMDDFKNRLPAGLEPKDIDFAILSHAHVDHCGYLPKLVKDGFRGKVYVTPATADLMHIILPDSGYLQEEAAKRHRARYERDHLKVGTVASEAGDNRSSRRQGEKSSTRVNMSRSNRARKEQMASRVAATRGANAADQSSSKTSPRFQPLYTQEQAQASLKYLECVDYDTRFSVTDSVAFTFTEAGHILGAAVVNLEIGTGSQKRTFCFSGNIGRPNMPLLRDLAPVAGADYVMVESTYGNRLHQVRDRFESLASKLNSAHERAKVKHPKFGCGVILIPAFAVGRAQAILSDIRELMESGRVPDMPVYIDGRMTLAATQVHRKYARDMGPETRALLEAGKDPYAPPRHALIEEWRDSDALHRAHNEPIIIVGSSGMAAGGRIVNHLKYWLGGKQNTVMFVGFQGTGTLGSAIVRCSKGERPDSVDAATQTANTVRVAGVPTRISATIDFIPDYSAHADWRDTVNWLGKFTRRPKKTFVVHGDAEATESLKEHIEDKLGWNGVVVPDSKQVFEL